MQVRVRVKEYLDEHKITPKTLATALRGQVAQASVYALLKADRVKRVDLHTLSGVITALQALTGTTVQVGDLLQQTEDGVDDTKMAELLRNTPVTPWAALKALSGSFPQDEVLHDEDYWISRRAERSELLRRELDGSTL